MANRIRVAIVHDWLTGMRGGEYVLEAIAELFPRSELFTLLYVPGRVSPQLSILKRHTSWLQKVPHAENRYRYFLPLMPSMIERFDLRGFDLILSSSHCVAKGVIKPEGAVHVSYIHAPMRYIWDRYDDYFSPGNSSFPVRAAAKLVRSRLQRWDREASSKERIQTLISNSHFIADQVRRAYGRESQVIYPFADLSRFQAPRKPGRFYLIVTAFAPYKRIDRAIRAFNALKLPLVIVGSGQDANRLKKLAGPTVDFLGPLSNSAIADLYAKCKAFVFPGVEDFGITPVEAMAAGAPVIALNAGGAAETVTEQTGVFFAPEASEEGTLENLIQAIQKFERDHASDHGLIDELACRKRAAEFSKDHFKQRFFSVVQQAWIQTGKNAEAFPSDPSQVGSS